MSYVSLEPLLEKTGNLYQLVLLAAQRAVQLANGEPKFVDSPQKAKVSSVALEELRQGKIGIKRPKSK